MRRFLALLALCLAGCSSMPAGPVIGQGADVATTAVGLSMGAAELNPLGMAALAVKLPLIALANDQAEPQRTHDLTFIEAMGWTAAGWNIGMLALGPPFAIVAAVGAGVVAWNRNADKRELVAECTRHKAVREPQGLPTWDCKTILGT